jgi:secreted PhoX family phosphatase
MERRQFLQAGSALALASLFERPALASGERTSPLLPDPRGLLDLPAGFSYDILHRTGEPMSDGFHVPGRPDGMGCFDLGAGKLALLRNHEMPEGDSSATAFHAGRPAPPEAYDPAAGGGVTRIVVDARSGRRLSSNLALAGTYWNCAGGPSPWGWLSCEETLSPNHGYVFLVRPEAEGVQAALPLRALGRFRHEAAVTHPKTLVTYLTEDAPDAAFYRLLPRDRDHPFEGRLQALALEGLPRADTARLPRGVQVPVRWVDLDHVDTDATDLRLRAHEAGAARIARGEGIHLDGDTLYFTATIGGPIGRGQILRLELGEGRDTLDVLAESRDPATLDMPDNLTVSPQGELFVCEDGLGRSHLHRVTPDGRTLPFAANANGHGELAGPCFSPDGTLLFLNLQSEGTTVVIRGPFAKIPLDRLVEPSPVPAGVLGLSGGLTLLALAALRARRT